MCMVLIKKKNFVMSKFLHAIKKNKPLTVYGDGKQIRSFCNVDDAADGLIEVLFNGKKNTIYNIGNSNEPISILNLAKKIKQITKSSVPIKKISYDKSDRSINREIFKRIPSIKKISKDTSYFPKVNLEDGIRGLIKKKDNFDIKQKIGLGTLQWGLKYGIANKNGKLSLNEIKKVKKIAEKNHIDLLDTAHAYGDCEQRIGKVNFKNFNIVTKLPATEPGKNRYNWTLKSINDALKKFKTNKIYCMHVHNTKYLLDKNGVEIYKALSFAKSKGLISKIGVSVYTIEELKKIINKFKIDLVLLPFNIFDQRTLKKNFLKSLKEKNIEIHARTSFLQGLLLMPRKDIPLKFSKYYKYFDNWEKLVKKLKKSKYEICLQYALSNKYIDKVIVGVDSSKQFKELVLSAKTLKVNIKSLDASNEIGLINPSKW